MNRFFILVCLVTALGFANTASSFGGEVTVIKGKDKEDGSLIEGFRIASENKQAYLFFLCDDDKQRPQIMITHRHVIGKPTDPFKVFYKIDDQAEQRHWFLVKGSGRTGYFFVRFPIEYKRRFGDQPPSFLEGGTAVNPEYIVWDQRIYATVISDFLNGSNALVRIQDKQDQDHLYAFSLGGLTEKSSVIDACYDPSIVND